MHCGYRLTTCMTCHMYLKVTMDMYMHHYFILRLLLGAMTSHVVVTRVMTFSCCTTLTHALTAGSSWRCGVWGTVMTSAWNAPSYSLYRHSLISFTRTCSHIHKVINSRCVSSFNVRTCTHNWICILWQYGFVCQFSRWLRVFKQRVFQLDAGYHTFTTENFFVVSL